MKKGLKKQKGFTLIEMTIVLFIISLLILIIVPNISRSRQNAQNVHKGAMVSVVQSQIDAYLDDHPDSSSVDYGTLQNKKYLTSSQVKKARDEEKIHIVQNDGSSNKDSAGVKAIEK